MKLDVVGTDRHCVQYNLHSRPESRPYRPRLIKAKYCTKQTATILITKDAISKAGQEQFKHCTRGG